MKRESMLSSVMKRDGSVAAWDASKVRAAVLKALAETGEGGEDQALFVSTCVEMEVLRALRVSRSARATVEGVQDVVERILMEAGYSATAKAYILYRARQAEARERQRAVPQAFRAASAVGSAYFGGSQYREFIYYRTYSRWVEGSGRRETWPETVDRYFLFMGERTLNALPPSDVAAAREEVLRMGAVPSMRLMWSAGAAARASNVSAYNCSYDAPQEPRDFAEMLYLLACGTGVGFAAESRNVQRLPVVSRRAIGTFEARVHDIQDSKEGWAEALRTGMEEWYEGGDVEYDYRGIRPEGARLLTMGGRASGPGPLRRLLDFARSLFLRRQGRRLTNLDVHDLCCHIGDSIVSGGVRRAALISLSDLDDVAVRGCKAGPYGSWPRFRELANNSAVYEERPPAAEFMREWLSLAESGTGERGVFNRGSLAKQVPERRTAAWAEMGVLNGQVGTNPCGEIYLLPKQFCNLTEVVMRAGDSMQDLLRKVRVAALLGTYQSTLTDFAYLSPAWRANCERERLLGVSLTGQWDHALSSDADALRMLRQAAVQENERAAALLGISPSTAVTCVKPSGTVSQLVDASSGCHPRFAPFYVRGVLVSSSDPLCKMLRQAGVPCAPKAGEPADSASAWFFEFPEKAPEGALCAAGVTALDQLAHWLRLKEHFTEHNPSTTVLVGPDEWLDVGHWVWEHWHQVGGLAFLPRGGGVYAQAPFREVDQDEYLRRVAAMPRIDWSELCLFEREDETRGSKELACAAGACELAA